MSKQSDAFNHLLNLHGFKEDDFFGEKADFDFLMQIHEEHHHHASNLRHCGVWNKKRDKPCENKAIVRLTFPNNSQLILCNAHTLNVSRVSQDHWSEINIERI